MKLGRRPRKFNPRIPHMSAIIGGRQLPPVPPVMDWTAKLPSSLGMMLNDQLGCCTCAGIFHALQVWTANANPPMDTEPDSSVEIAYEKFCGYKPGDPSTDNGGVEQDVLTDWLNQGVDTAHPLGTPDTINKLTAFYEVDSRNLDDVRRTIADCGVAYIGFNVPAYLMANGNPPDVWCLPQGAEDESIEGGHCVILCGYDADTFKLISWGRVYSMTTGFFQKFVDEVYGPVDADWVNSQGTTPLGLSLGELEAQMGALKIS